MQQILISFDDTGSMRAVRSQVRQKINEFVDESFAIEPDLEIGIIIHNDYCDHDLIQTMDFTSDREKIRDFVNRSSSQGGGDHREAYAYVLHEMRDFSWKDGKKAAILIGDAPPHEKGKKSAGHVELYDWREEVNELAKIGVDVYPIQALNRGPLERSFYEGIATIAGTVRLDLAQFHHIVQYVLAILHKQAGSIDEYAESSAEFKSNISLRNMFAALTGKTVDHEFSSKIDMLGKFQVSDVPHEARIKDFVEDMGIRYKAGRGFYQWTKGEMVQRRKEVLFVNKHTGETIFDTAWCREQLGIPLGTERKIYPRDHRSVTATYDVFIQSTSYTRKLMPGTKFLYEIDAH